MLQSRFPFLLRVFPAIWRALAVGHLALFLLVFVPRTLGRTDSERDVVIYHQTAQNVRNGHAIYTARPLYGPDQKPFDFLYPPPFAAALWPWGGLDFLAFARYWTLFLLACWLGFSAHLVFLAGEKWTFANFASAHLVSGLAYGSYRAFSLGQIDPALWFLFALGVWALGRQKTSLSSAAGVGFALASLAKIYSIWSLFAVRGMQQPRVWLGAVATLLIGFGLGVFVCGLQSYRDWFLAVPPVASQGTFDGDNFSLSMGVLRLADWLGWNYEGGPFGAGPKLWLSAATFGGPVAALWLTRRLENPERAALVGVVAALWAPICWSNYLPLLLVPLALAWKRNRTDKATR